MGHLMAGLMALFTAQLQVHLSIYFSGSKKIGGRLPPGHAVCDVCVCFDAVSRGWATWATVPASDVSTEVCVAESAVSRPSFFFGFFIVSPSLIVALFQFDLPGRPDRPFCPTRRSA